MYRLLRLSVLLLLSLPTFTFAAGEVIATRIWPSPEYTRITLESESIIKYEQMILQNPERIVVDLKNRPKYQKYQDRTI